MLSPLSLVKARERMLRLHLAARGINSRRVLAAMEKVPRERFLPLGLAAHAYDDRALPIDCEQTISQPYIVALMTQSLALTGQERVLEVGTGSGYQAAILAELALEVVTIERHAALSEQAAKILRELGYLNVHFVVGDGGLGWKELAPYDRIIVTAAAEHLPRALWDQLREGGLLVAPLGATKSQELVLIHKVAGKPELRRLTGCRFVPLLGGTPDQ